MIFRDLKEATAFDIDWMHVIAKAYDTIDTKLLSPKLYINKFPVFTPDCNPACESRPYVKHLASDSIRATGKIGKRVH